VVHSIEPECSVDDWNVEVSPVHQIQIGDRVDAVAGEGGDVDTILDSLTRLQISKIQGVIFDLTRPTPLTIKLKAPFGIQVNSANVSWLVITNIEAGVLDNWNRENPNEQVRPEDAIIAVNGRKGYGTNLVDEVRKIADEAEITFLCYSVRSEIFLSKYQGRKKEFVERVSKRHRPSKMVRVPRPRTAMSLPCSA